MNKPQIFFRLTKFDEIKGEVTGIATAELPDQTGEICDYETTKPLYQKWSERISKSTSGKSLGNVREMHSNIAAGKIIDIVFDDAAKAIIITAKVVDQGSLTKVREGVLTGFSQGGEYVKKWKDGEHTRYTADPSEVSLVDNPCLAEATFEVIKSDGSTEMRKFVAKQTPVIPELEQVWQAKDKSTWRTKAEAQKQNTLVDARAAVAKTTEGMQELLDGIEDAIGKREFTDEERAAAAKDGSAMEDGSFPIKSEQDLKNAIRAVGRASDPAKAKEHIIARAKAMGLESTLPTEWEGGAKEADKTVIVTMKKDLCTVARVASLLEELNWVHTCAEMEEAWEEDTTSEAPGMLTGIVKQLCEFLCSYVEEECSEIVEDKGGTGIEMPMQMSAGHLNALQNVFEKLNFRNNTVVWLEKVKPIFEAFEKAKAAKEDAEIPAPNMDHVHAIHKAASQIMKKCMKCMGTEAEKVFKAVEGGDEMHEHIKAIHKKAASIAVHAIDLGAKPDEGDDDAPDAGDDDTTEKFAKISAVNGELQKVITGLTTQLTEMHKRLTVVEAQPAARKGTLMIVTKGHERDDEPKQESADETKELQKSLNISGLSPEEARQMLT